MFLRHHLDSLSGQLARDGPAVTGLGLQLKPQLITLQPDVQLAPADTQLLADHLPAHAAMNHLHSFAAKG